MSRGHNKTQKSYRNALEIARKTEPRIGMMRPDHQRLYLKSIIRQYGASQLPPVPIIVDGVNEPSTM
jgi:hypothetical protein